MGTKTLKELAKTIRSKNASPDKLTFDIIFQDPDIYRKIKEKNAITREAICALYNIEDERISDFVYFDPAYAVKFTIYRAVSSGGPGDSDILGCQQYAPLLDMEIRLN
jgi:hypothetical protein